MKPGFTRLFCLPDVPSTPVPAMLPGYSICSPLPPSARPPSSPRSPPLAGAPAANPEHVATGGTASSGACSRARCCTIDCMTSAIWRPGKLSWNQFRVQRLRRRRKELTNTTNLTHKPHFLGKPHCKCQTCFYAAAARQCFENMSQATRIKTNIDTKVQAN